MNIHLKVVRHLDEAVPVVRCNCEQEILLLIEHKMNLLNMIEIGASIAAQHFKPFMSGLFHF